MNTVKNYEALANAIVLQAANDYREVSRILAEHPNDRSARCKKTHLLRFFRSEWFGTLTKIEPEYLIRRLNKEAAA